MALLLIAGVLLLPPQTRAYTIINPTVPSRLETYQETAGRIAASFTPNEFKPFPLFSNSHLQTIGAVYWRDIPHCSYVVDLPSTLQALGQWALQAQNPTPERRFWDRRERVETPDEDWFHVDHKDCPTTAAGGTSKGLLILMHGLEASSESPLSIDMAKAFCQIDLDVTCINFRSCSGEPNDTVRLYHLGFTDDLKLYLDRVKHEKRPIYIAGFSLGANVLLKALGELSSSAVEEYNIQGATAFCAPLNDVGYKSMLVPGINRNIYAKNLLRSMKRKTKYKLEQCCHGDPDTDQFDYWGCVEATTIYEFENAYIARVYGFEDTIDYYKKTSCITFLQNIAVPTLILNGDDDPFFIEGKSDPMKLAYENGGKAPLKVINSRHGGHCGFIFHQLDPDVESIPSASWGSCEMARFIHHVMKNTSCSSNMNVVHVPFG